MSHAPKDHDTDDPFAAAMRAGLPPLSAEGERRRTEIGRAIVLRSARRRLVRRLSRAVGVLIAAGVVGLAARARVGDGGAGDSPVPVPPPTPGVRPMEPVVPASATPPAVRVHVVRDDPAVIERCAIDDEALLQMLHEIGRPAGLIRTRDGVMLTRGVVDAVPVGAELPG